MPRGGFWRELLNSEASCYGGSGEGNQGGRQALDEGYHGQPHSLSLDLPGLSFSFFEPA